MQWRLSDLAQILSDLNEIGEFGDLNVETEVL